MKLVIDIPDNDYRHIKEYYEKNDIVEATYSYIYHGIPLNEVLDKISAEIKEDGDKWQDTLFGDGIRYCLRIIDKYREEQE